MKDKNNLELIISQIATEKNDSDFVKRIRLEILTKLEWESRKYGLVLKCKSNMTFLERQAIAKIISQYRKGFNADSLIDLNYNQI